MKKLHITLLSTLALFSSQVFAASISIGPYEFDTDAAATDAAFTGEVYQNVSGAITDGKINTYLRGDTDDAAVSLEFNNIALSNQDGNDLALFFISTGNDISISIAGSEAISFTSRQLFVNPDDPFVDIGEMYMVEDIVLPAEGGDIGAVGNAELSVIFVDLEAFNFDFEQSISNIDIDLGNSLMTYAVGMNSAIEIDTTIAVQAVPLPAPVLLFLSGLAGLGLFGRRKK